MQCTPESIYQGNEPNIDEPKKLIAEIAFLLVPAVSLHLARPAMVAGHQSSPPCSTVLITCSSDFLPRSLVKLIKFAGRGQAHVGVTTQRGLACGS